MAPYARPSACEPCTMFNLYTARYDAGRLRMRLDVNRQSSCVNIFAHLVPAFSLYVWLVPQQVERVDSTTGQPFLFLCKYLWTKSGIVF